MLQKSRKSLRCCWSWNGAANWLQPAASRPKNWAASSGACIQEVKVVFVTQQFIHSFRNVPQLSAYPRPFTREPVPRCWFSCSVRKLPLLPHPLHLVARWMCPLYTPFVVCWTRPFGYSLIIFLRLNSKSGDAPLPLFLVVTVFLQPGRNHFFFLFPLFCVQFTDFWFGFGWLFIRKYFFLMSFSVNPHRYVSVGLFAAVVVFLCLCAC